MTPGIDEIRSWQKQIHELARAKGWYDCRACNGSGEYSCRSCKGNGTERRNVLEMIALIHAELSEALEFYRKNNKGFELHEVFNEGFRNSCGDWVEKIDGKTGVPKPDGFAIELADVFIRLLDLAEYCGIDLAGAVVVKHAFNEKSAYRHGGLVA